MNPRICPKRPIILYRNLSHKANISNSTSHVLQPSSPKPMAPLSVMPTKTLIRSMLLTSMMSSPLLDPCLSVMKAIVNSKSRLLSPGKNPFINRLLRSTVYEQFCAGINEREVKRNVRSMKEMGFKGVILGSGREVVVKMDDSTADAAETQKRVNEETVEAWKECNLETLKMIGQGDYLNVKFTGAGPMAVDALSRGEAPPDQIRNAIIEICRTAAAQNSRLWIDAEQQVFQPTIDAWTIDLMREFNRNGAVVVLNTIQAYLKASTENVERHLRLAQEEGWSLGIKLVRGAYIAHDTRERIHDTKADTDRSYNHIVKSLVTRKYPLHPTSNEHFPSTRLFVASHNAETVRKAYTLHKQRILAGQPTIPIEFGQLQGMADEISCELLAENRKGEDQATWSAPGVFKALCWGTTEECLHFLLRRAVENKGAVVRTREMAAALRGETWRRLRGVLVFGQ